MLHYNNATLRIDENEGLIAWLNTKRPAQRRVIELITHCSRFLQQARTKGVTDGRLIADINRRLLRYKFRREIWPVRPSASAPLGFSIILKSNVPAPEGWVADVVMRLVETGALERLRQCAECREWFLARRKDQNWCKTSHRRKQERNRQDPKAVALYQAFWRRKREVEDLKEGRSGRNLRPSERKKRILKLKREQKEKLDQRRRILNGKD
jgi:hypothetical protein